MSGGHNVATPLLPVSSEISDNIMNISPLSHRGLSSTEITSPRPDNLPEDNDDDRMMLQAPIANFCNTSHTCSTEKRLVLRSFSSACTKGHSAIVSANHLDLDAESAAFGSSFKTTLPLVESLPRVLANSPSPSGLGSSRQKLQRASLSGTREFRNSSLSSPSRRQSNPSQSFRRQIRRSLSMFENPITPQSALQSVMDIEDVQNPILPHFYPEGEHGIIPRISQETFLDALEGKFENQYTQRIVIDCRFDYEYEGGHIDGAINYYDKGLLMKHLFETTMEGNVLIILHCEYSAHRAPIMARYIRSEDRAINAEYYPRLSYPEIYILDGGYSEFFTQHRYRCFPQSYVEMNDKKHVATCKREMGKLQRNRKGLDRAKTFTFGPRKSFCEASPTVTGRNSSRDGNSFNPGVGRSLNRRAALY